MLPDLQPKTFIKSNIVNDIVLKKKLWLYLTKSLKARARDLKASAGVVIP